MTPYDINMADVALKNQIIDWLKTYPYWFQYAGNLILENGVISSSDSNTIYKYFKEDSGLETATDERPTINYNEVTTEASAVSVPYSLVGIKNIKNVNALTSDQSIVIGSNLTVIYGGNGAGKSGYIRLLNNAFDSRGDKKILRNVFMPEPAEPEEPTCTFSFNDGAATYDLNYPNDKTKAEFNKFSIFDTHSIRVHLEGDNKLNFTPSGFEFFEVLVELYEDLKSKLNAEINLKRPANPHINTFLNDNAVKEFISNIGADTDIELLKQLAGLNDAEKIEYNELLSKRVSLKALDIPKKIAELQELKNAVNNFSVNQQKVLDCLNQDKIKEYTSLLNDYASFQKMTQEEGISKFEHYNIESLGSPEWKGFIQAAKRYADKISSERGENHYPTLEDNCLLCLRPLTEPQQSLITAYWNLLKSAAGAELQRIENCIGEAIAILNSIADISFDESSIVYTHIHSTSPDLAKRWKEISATAHSLKRNIVTNLTSREIKHVMQYFSFHTSELNPVLEAIQSQIDNFLVLNPVSELAEIEKKILLMQDREALGKISTSIFDLITSYKWVANADRKIGTFNTMAITKKQGELFGIYVTDQYTKLFNIECERLNAPKVVSIVQKNSKISSLRKLQINGVVANSVLSEGEQRVISLADFITEIQLNPYNKGIIFDDPVTSQDHIRKEIIADRIAALAKDRQVIVFTHDISFFIRLQLTAEAVGANCVVTTMRSWNGLHGIINPDLPWVAQKITDRIKFLRNDLNRLKAAEKSGDVDNYLVAVKSWYGLLREGWERGVEERLFKGVIERFGYGIQTQKLKKVVITAELLKEIEIGMTNCSNWVHDAAAGRNPEPPTIAQAEADLNALDEFAKKCQAA